MNTENKEIYELSAEEQRQKLQFIGRMVSQGFLEGVMRVVPIITECVRQLCEKVAPVSRENRRVIHLAKHSKKARVRKKNRNRIKKMIQRGLKKNG